METIKPSMKSCLKLMSLVGVLAILGAALTACSSNESNPQPPPPAPAPAAPPPPAPMPGS